MTKGGVSEISSVQLACVSVSLQELMLEVENEI